MEQALNPSATAAGEISLCREFAAPRGLVWKAWTEPAHMMRWWGPRAFTTPSCEIDLREGGAYLFCMRSPEGQDIWGTGRYLEVVAPERIVCTDSFADAAGHPVPASHYGMEGDWPLEMRVEVGFAEAGGRTRLTLRHTGFPAGFDRDQAAQGWDESFDKLAAALREMLG